MDQPEQRSRTRLTKIVCTIGPSTRSSETLEALARTGMNVARLNMSHGDHVSHLQVIRNLKSLGKKLPHPVSILMDLQGPEIRTGELAESLDLKPARSSTSAFSLTTPKNEASTSTTKISSRIFELASASPSTTDSSISRCSRCSSIDSSAECSTAASSGRANTSTCPVSG